MAASILEDMNRSVQLLSGLPDQSTRINTLQQYKKELEGQLAPKLDSSLYSKQEDQLVSLYKIYCSLHLESTFIQSFCQFYASSFTSYLLLFLSLVESGIPRLLNLLLILFKISIPIFTPCYCLLVILLFMSLMIRMMVLLFLFLFILDVLLQLIEIGCRSISSLFLSHLATIPIVHFTHSLEAAYSYMEILSGSISNEEKRVTCLQILLQDWYSFTTSSYVQSEYTCINDQLNQLSKLVFFFSFSFMYRLVKMISLLLFIRLFSLFFLPSYYPCPISKIIASRLVMVFFFSNILPQPSSASFFFFFLVIFS